MKSSLLILTLTITLASNLSHACDVPPTPSPVPPAPQSVPDAGSVYTLAALAAGGLVMARRKLS